MRLLATAVLFVLLTGPRALSEPPAEPRGWRTRIQTQEGSLRRPWYLALVFHADSKEVTLRVAPAASAGGEAQDDAVERIERSATGDFHQMQAWAKRLHEEAQGWRRPSLRERPPASAHVIGVIRSVAGEVRAENCEHGPCRLTVGDFLLVEDIVSTDTKGGVAFLLIGPENVWHRRVIQADIRCTAGIKLGLGGKHDELTLHLHRGAMTVSADDRALSLRTEHASYTAQPKTSFQLSRTGDEQLDVGTGSVKVETGASEATIAGGTAWRLDSRGAQSIAPNESDHEAASGQEPECTRKDALLMVERLQGTWRGSPRKASVTLQDDGQWRSYERQPGRSVNKGGAWTPRPGGLVEMTHVFTHRRSKQQRKDVYRYVLDGDVLVRLIPSGPVFLRQPNRP